MSISSNLYTGTSGLSAHGDAIGVVGDNIANVSTVGFKSSRAGFSDILGGVTARGQRVGVGVQLGAVQSRFGQGSIQQTGGPLDMAVRGDGFFVLQGDNAGVPGQYFSRDGRFSLNEEGFVTNPNGLRLQGYTIAPDGTQNSSLGDLKLGAGQNPPLPTSDVSMVLNLNGTDTAPPAFDPADPNNTSNFATSMTVYDSLGTERRVDMYFRTSGSGAWEWHAMVDGDDVTGGTPGTPVEAATGTLQFDANGALDVETPGAATIDFQGAAAGQSLAFDFGDAITTDAGTGLTGTTQFSGPSSVSSLNQDGYGFGDLVDISVSDDGTMQGVFSNGQRRAIARVALADFTSEDGLARAGGALFTETPDSGQALIDGAAVGGRGAVTSGALEMSNVDLATELVTMISYQRAFSANVKTVTTADEMLAEVSSLKR